MVKACRQYAFGSNGLRIGYLITAVYVESVGKELPPNFAFSNMAVFVSEKRLNYLQQVRANDQVSLNTPYAPDITSSINVHVPRQNLRVPPTFFVNKVIGISPLTHLTHFCNILGAADINCSNFLTD